MAALVFGETGLFGDTREAGAVPEMATGGGFLTRVGAFLAASGGFIGLFLQFALIINRLSNVQILN